MKIKEGVVLTGLDIRIRPALKAGDAIWKDLGQILVVTSGLEGEHSAGSLHYYGRAIDFRCRYFSEEDKRVAVLQLKALIGKEFDVFHGVYVDKDGNKRENIHVEYDPKFSL